MVTINSALIKWSKLLLSTLQDAFIKCKYFSCDCVNNFLILRFLTGIMSSVHPSMMVTHSIEVIQIVMGEDHVSRLVVLSWGLLPGRCGRSQVQVPHTLSSLHYMRGHVQTSKGEAHQGWQLVPSLAHLFKQISFKYASKVCRTLHIAHSVLLGI